MEARILSVSEPTNVETGAIWIKPYPVWAAYLRLGSMWTPITSSDATAIEFDNTTVLINGIKKNVQRNSLSITDNLSNEVDECTFVIEDTDGTNKPALGQEVQIFYKQTSSSTPELIFAGRIMEMPQTKIGVQKYAYEVVVNDYSQDMLRINHNDTYENQTAGAIIKDILRVSAKEIGTLYVQDGETIEYFVVNYKFPLQTVTDIAELINYDWYVDQYKQLHFFERTTNTAPYSLTDSLTDSEYAELEITVDKSQIKNKQIVRGGYELSNLYTQLKVADGEQTSFNLDYKPFSPMTIYVDSGAGYVEKTLGIDNIDSSGCDFVVNVSEKTIKNLDLATLSAGHIIKITYKYQIPVFGVAIDEVSIDAMKVREGGSGVYEGEIIVDDKIESSEAARQRAEAEIVIYSNPLVEGSFTTLQYGYRSGQLLTVNIPSRAENNTYLIQSVTTTSLGNGRMEYEISFATKLKSLSDFLVDLFDRSADEFTRTDEILDTFHVLNTETMTITDSDLTGTKRDTTANPYVWSNDEGTTENKGQWSLASWG